MTMLKWEEEAAKERGAREERDRISAFLEDLAELWRGVEGTDQRDVCLAFMSASTSIKNGDHNK